MPLYEYKCQQCKRHTEKRQKFSDAEITECPHCGGHLERVISAPAIAFKGGGWYADGYGNAKPKATSDGKAGGEAKSDAGTADSGAKTAVSGGDSSGSTGSGSAAAPAATAPSAPAAAPATPAKS